MTPERWQQIRQVLDEALSLDIQHRLPYLDKACSSDPELRREVESFLSSDDQAGSRFLNTPAIDLDRQAVDPISLPTRVGHRIGAYDILEKIGQGGMGDVYRAARADGQFTKQVAVKLVRGGFDSAFLMEQFRNERQILAGLDHPNIARLLDGGTTDDGTPYLVMELVAGVPIDVYCDAHKLSISERLLIFRDVCSAVQYAHQRLVIHRDIKPGNILVTEDGTPKLLDFGIAKLLDPSASKETTLVRPMTPEYASPEQLRGETITTATDVYSLGVVLYRLLTGRSPYAGETRNPHDLARRICETEPTRPSAVVLSAEPAIDPMSSSQEDSAAKLHRRLAGDLDNILLMALRKEPQRRYGSVEQLSEDVRRHLEGLPVMATSGSWRYLSEKFVTRHKVGVAATAVVTLALAGGVGATLREARIARQQAEIARQERARAEERFNDVRELSDSLIFDVHDAIQNLPGATPARKLLLDRAVEYSDRVAKDSGGEPDLQRELAWGYQRLAVVQGSPTESNLGDPQAAEASNRKATALFEAVAKANPDNIIDQLNVAMGHRILAFSSLLEPSGRRDLEQAMTITERLLKIDDANPKVRSERSIEYQNLGYMYDGVGERAQALAAFQKNLEIKKDLFKTTPGYRRIREGIGVASVIVADEQVKLGSRQEAMPKMQTAIELFESVLKDSPDIDINVARELEITRLKIGELQLMDGQSAAAQATFRQVRAKLAPMAKSDPENSMLQLDMAAIDYEDGKILVSTGRYAAAVAPLQDAIKTFESLHTQTRSGGDIGSGVGDFYIWLGEAQAGMHRPEEALKDYQKAAADLESIKPMGDDTRCALATAEVKIANALLQIGKPREALAEYTKALSNTDVSAALQRRDIPALYPVADAYAGLGDASFTLAQEAASAKEQSQQWKGARDSYAQSLSTWHEIPNPSRITPNGFRAGDPHHVARKLSDIEKNKASLAGSA